jgi:hypothetical protein
MNSFAKRADRATEGIALHDDEGGWIAVARRPFSDYSVGSLVPVVFERFARVLHPATAKGNAPVRWHRVAAWSGRRIHALAQWEAVSRPLRNVVSERPFVREPESGGLRGTDLAALIEHLAAHTTTADDCYVGIWHGFGWLDRADLASTMELRLDQRTVLVRRGPIRTAHEVGWRHRDGTFVSEAPTLMWPADRSWFVAGDVDLDSTYLGGSTDLINSLLADPSLEVWEVGSADAITISSDLVNHP